jgi:hypothetical protein
MILSHTDGMAIGNPVKLHFQEPIWQTTGSMMVADLHWITRWKQADIRKEGHNSPPKRQARRHLGE